MEFNRDKFWKSISKELSKIGKSQIPSFSNLKPANEAKLISLASDMKNRKKCYPKIKDLQERLAIKIEDTVNRQPVTREGKFIQKRELEIFVSKKKIVDNIINKYKKLDALQKAIEDNENLYEIISKFNNKDYNFISEAMNLMYKKVDPSVYDYLLRSLFTEEEEEIKDEKTAKIRNIVKEYNDLVDLENQVIINTAKNIDEDE